MKAHIEPCFAFRLETSYIIGRVKIEWADPALDLNLDELAIFLSDAVSRWASSSGSNASSVEVPITRLGSAPRSGDGHRGGSSPPGPWAKPPSSPMVVAVPGSGNSSQTADDAQPSRIADRPFIPTRTLASVRFHPSGRVPEERTSRAARLGKEWRQWLSSATPQSEPPPCTEGAEGVTPALRLVLKGGPWDAWGSRPSLHDRKGTPGPVQHEGYWSRVAERTTWRTHGEAHPQAAYEPFGSMEEVVLFLEAAAYEREDVFDCRSAGSRS